MHNPTTLVKCMSERENFNVLNEIPHKKHFSLSIGVDILCRTVAFVTDGF